MQHAHIMLLRLRVIKHSTYQDTQTNKLENDAPSVQINNEVLLA